MDDPDEIRAAAQQAMQAIEANVPRRVTEVAADRIERDLFMALAGAIGKDHARSLACYARYSISNDAYDLIVAFNSRYYPLPSAKQGLNYVQSALDIIEQILDDWRAHGKRTGSNPATD